MTFWDSLLWVTPYCVAIAFVFMLGAWFMEDKGLWKAGIARLSVKSNKQKPKPNAFPNDVKE